MASEHLYLTSSVLLSEPASETGDETVESDEKLCRGVSSIVGGDNGVYSIYLGEDCAWGVDCMDCRDCELVRCIGLAGGVCCCCCCCFGN